MVTRTLLQSESIERDGRPICDVRSPEGQAHTHDDRRDLRLVAGTAGGSPFLAADRPHQQVTSNTQHATTTGLLGVVSGFTPIFFVDYHHEQPVAIDHISVGGTSSHGTIRSWHRPALCITRYVRDESKRNESSRNETTLLERWSIERRSISLHRICCFCFYCCCCQNLLEWWCVFCGSFRFF